MGKDPVTIRDYSLAHRAALDKHVCSNAHGGNRCDICFEEITATVTAGPTEEEWNDLEIPFFLRRSEHTAPAGGTAECTVPVPPAVGIDGTENGSLVHSTASGNFEQFRVDPNEIESKIKQEADRRWRAWVPTKEHLSRPRKSYYAKQVRKEFYP